MTPTKAGVSNQYTSVACPFCGLLCDDLSIAVEGGAARVAALGCKKSERLFALADAGTGPLLEGRPASFEAACARAGEILRAAAQPLLLNAGTDLAGMRALLELADRSGAALDHANGDAMARNFAVLQDSGWTATTLTEVRNRAELLVAVGTDIASRFPRFYERCFGEGEAMFVSGKRELWLLGARPELLPAALARRAQVIDVEPARLGEVFAALRALAAGRALGAPAVAGVPQAKLAALLERMRAVRYGVLAWAAADLDFPHAELAIQQMCELVNLLNEKGRFAVLPLGGSDGDLTSAQVSTWQSGYPLRVNFAGGAPDYDPQRWRAAGMLDSGAADALVFVSALDAGRAPPATRVPSVVLGRPGTPAEQASVFIPVATPGLHHAGHLFRSDNVVAVPLRKLVDSPLPSVAQALAGILAALGAGR